MITNRLSLSIIFLVLIYPTTLSATVLTAEDMALDFHNKKMGVFVKVPHTWVQEPLDQATANAKETAHQITGKVLGVSAEEAKRIDVEGSEKSILLRMHATHPELPAVQISTRGFENASNPPASDVEHLTGYIQFINAMTPVNIVTAIHETRLNGSPCAHVSYHTRIVLNGYTHLVKYDVYSFWRKDRTVDLTIIQERDAVFKTQNEMDLNTVLNSVRIKV